MSNKSIMSRIADLLVAAGTKFTYTYQKGKCLRCKEIYMARITHVKTTLPSSEKWLSEFHQSMCDDCLREIGLEFLVLKRRRK